MEKIKKIRDIPFLIPFLILFLAFFKQNGYT